MFNINSYCTLLLNKYKPSRRKIILKTNNNYVLFNSDIIVL